MPSGRNNSYTHYYYIQLLIFKEMLCQKIHIDVSLGIFIDAANICITNSSYNYVALFHRGMRLRAVQCWPRLRDFRGCTRAVKKLPRECRIFFESCVGPADRSTWCSDTTRAEGNGNDELTRSLATYTYDTVGFIHLTRVFSPSRNIIIRINHSGLIFLR